MKRRQSDGEQIVPDLTDDTFLYETRMNSGSRWNICSPTGLHRGALGKTKFQHFTKEFFSFVHLATFRPHLFYGRLFGIPA